MGRKTIINDPVVSSFVFNFFTDGAAHMKLPYPKIGSYLFDSVTSFLANLSLFGGGIKVRPVTVSDGDRNYLFLFYSINEHSRVIYMDINPSGG